MEGVKGKWGGSRKNTGGARPGAGRKPKAVPVEKSANVPIDLPNSSNERDTLKLLQDIAFGRIEASNIQVRAAIAAVQYTHIKKGDGGKKEEKQAAAEKAATGKFGLRAVK